MARTWSSASTLLVACTLAIALLAGGATAQSGGDWNYTHEIAVDDGGEISDWVVTIGLSEAEYDALSADLEGSGYDSLAHAFAEDYVDSEDLFGDYADYGETEVDGGHEITVELEDVDATATDEVTIEAADGTVTAAFGWFDDPADSTYVGELTVAVTMPGEVTASNATAVDGDVATWQLHEEAPAVLTAETDEQASGGGDGSPGFSAALAIAAALVAALALARRR